MQMPQVSPIAEAGVPGYDFPIWYGIWVRSGTPSDLIHRIANDVSRVLARDDLRAWLAAHDAERLNMTRSEFVRFVSSESESAARMLEVAAPEHD